MAGTVAIGVAVNKHEPIVEWAFFHYARAVLAAVVFVVACLAAGNRITRWFLPRALPLAERATIVFATGVVAFYLVISALGFLGLLGWFTAAATPVLLVLFGATDLATLVQRLRRHLVARRPQPKVGWLGALALAFGLWGVAHVWFPILTPQNASYDARSYHLPIAEHYLARGGIVAFDEGWVKGAFPQLASLLYTWAFSLPKTLFDQMETAAHLELAIFLMTLVGVSAVTRRVLGRRAPLAWTALFLFSGIFCYDSGLVLGADHVAALWAPPLFLLTLRYAERPDPRAGMLLGALLAGALSTKLTAAILCVVPIGVIATKAASEVVRSRRLASLAPPASAAASVVVLTAPVWLRNALFYGDPLYPMLRRFFPAHPWSPAAEAAYLGNFDLRRPPVALEGAWETLKTLLSIGFVPHDFAVYHGDIPVFGFLFAVTAPMLLFLGKRPRLHLLFLAVYGGVALWFWIHQYDRYLQALVPWMAAATAAVLALTWERGALVRVALVALVALQVVWGGSVPFMATHRGVGGAIEPVVIDFLGSGFGRSKPDRFVAVKDFEALGKAIPAGAKVLVHEERLHLGLAAATASDFPGDQGLYYWGEAGAQTPAEIWRVLRAHGITHVVWADRLNHGADSVAGALAFLDFADRFTRRLGRFGGFVLAAVPPVSPPDEPPGMVGYYPCPTQGGSPSGLFPLGAFAGQGSRLSTPAPSDASFDQSIERAKFLVYDTRCQGPLPERARERFTLFAARGEQMLLAARKPAPPRAP